MDEEEFVFGFTSDGELTPIDIVAEFTGLTYDEIRSCYEIVKVEHPGPPDHDNMFNE